MSLLHPEETQRRGESTALEGLILFFLLMLMMAGAITATVPVSLMNPDSMATVPMIIANNRDSLFPANWMIFPLMLSARPVSITAPPTMNKEAIVITIGLEKPARASSGERILLTINKINSPRATRSTESHSVIKKSMAPPNKARVIQISIVAMFFVSSDDNPLA